MKWLLDLGCGVACAFAAVAALATAQGGAPTGTIHVCAAANGELRALPSSVSPCRPGERHVDWSASGPAGARGAQGVRGDAGASLPGIPGAPGPAATPQRVTAQLIENVPFKGNRPQRAEFEAVGHYDFVGCDNDPRRGARGETIWAGVNSAFTWLPKELTGVRGGMAGGYTNTLKNIEALASPIRHRNTWSIFQRDLTYANVDSRTYSRILHFVFANAYCYRPQGELAPPPVQPSPEVRDSTAVIQLQQERLLQAQLQLAQIEAQAKARQATAHLDALPKSTGTLTMTRSSSGRAAASAVVARGHFATEAGGPIAVPLRLTPAGRRQLRSRGRIAGTLNVVSRDASGRIARARVRLEILRKGARPSRGHKVPGIGRPKRHRRPVDLDRVLDAPASAFPRGPGG